MSKKRKKIKSRGRRHNKKSAPVTLSEAPVVPEVKVEVLPEQNNGNNNKALVSEIKVDELSGSNDLSLAEKLEKVAVIMVYSDESSKYLGANVSEALETFDIVVDFLTYKFEGKENSIAFIVGKDEAIINNIFQLLLAHKMVKPDKKIITRNGIFYFQSRHLELEIGKDEANNLILILKNAGMEVKHEEKLSLDKAQVA